MKNKNERVFFRHLRGSDTKGFPNETAYGTLCVIHDETKGIPFKVGVALCSKKDKGKFNLDANIFKPNFTKE